MLEQNKSQKLPIRPRAIVALAGVRVPEAGAAAADLRGLRAPPHLLFLIAVVNQLEDDLSARVGDRARKALAVAPVVSVRNGKAIQAHRALAVPATFDTSRVLPVADVLGAAVSWGPAIRLACAAGAPAVVAPAVGIVAASATLGFLATAVKPSRG